MAARSPDQAGDEPRRRGRSRAAETTEQKEGTALSSSAARPTSRTRARRTAAHDAAPASPTTAEGTATGPRRAKAARIRRPANRGRARESTILGLTERTRLQSEARPPLPLPDPLFVSLPMLRQALLNRPLDEGARAVAEGLAAVFAPAVAQVWIADPTPWASEQERVGGLELIPTLRPRASASAASRASLDGGAHTEQASDPSSSGSLPRPPVRSDPLVDEVATTRRPVVLFAADDHPLAREWRSRLPAVAVAPASIAADVPPSPALGTLAAYPLRARGQFLGVLAVGSARRLTPRHLATLEELADLTAMAADRDRLLSYSRSQEALAQTVVRHAPVAVAVLSGSDHVFALANPAFNMLLGLDDATDLTGRRLAEIVPERARTLATSLRLDAVYQGGEPQAMIELPIHLDRGMTYWNVTSSPLPGISASVGGVLVAAVDVTRQVISRQRAQEVAEVAQERIGQMMTLHATSLAVASQLGADPRELLADILRRSIALLNARAGTVYVRDPRHDDLEVIVCQGLRGDYTGSRIRMGEGLAGRVAQTGQGLYVDDYRAYPSRAAIYDGEDFRTVIAVPLIQRGQVIGVLDVLDDAERRAFTDDDLWLLDLFAAQAAQAIETARTFVELEHAYRKQRELDRMKDDFIATASHELRTPLTGVQGFIDLLIDYPGSRDEPLALDFLQRASESAQELAEIAERLLQTSRLDTGRMDLHVVPVRLATVVEEVLRSFRELQQAQGHTHELSAEIAPDVYVQADLGRLKEVLDNLVSNAIKYSPAGGRVTVRCAPAAFAPDDDALAAAEDERDIPAGLDGTVIDDRPTIVLPHLTPEVSGPTGETSRVSPLVVAAARERPYFVVTVSDQGMGIPEEERARLFGRFSRLESARVSQIRGTGLGLYICRQTMRAMSGDVWLDSSVVGAGSTFACALPQAEEQSAERLAVAAGSSQAQR